MSTTNDPNAFAAPAMQQAPWPDTNAPAPTYQPDPPPATYETGYQPDSNTMAAPFAAPFGAPYLPNPDPRDVVQMQPVYPPGILPLYIAKVEPRFAIAVARAAREQLPPPPPLNEIANVTALAAEQAPGGNVTPGLYNPVPIRDVADPNGPYNAAPPIEPSRAPEAPYTPAA